MTADLTFKKIDLLSFLNLECVGYNPTVPHTISSVMKSLSILNMSLTQNRLCVRWRFIYKCFRPTQHPFRSHPPMKWSTRELYYKVPFSILISSYATNHITVKSCNALLLTCFQLDWNLIAPLFIFNFNESLVCRTISIETHTNSRKLKIS